MFIFQCRRLRLVFMANTSRMKTSQIVNREVNNSSMGIKKMFFDKFDGETIVEISTGGYLNNGYIYIEVKTNSKIEVFYKNILIFSSNCGYSALILHQNSISSSFLKINCNMKQNQISELYKRC